MEKPSIAVLLTCFNRRVKTLEALRHLYNQKNIGESFSLDIFLVDDGSTDGTSESVKNKYPKVKVIPGSGSLFWNRGMHLAWQTAINNSSYDYYLWLNDDTMIKSDAIGEILECSNLSANRSIVCGAVCSAESGSFTYGGRSKDGKPVLPNGSLQTCFEMNGNIVLVPKSVFEKIGVLDTVFPHAIGDFDYGLRALRSGFKIVTTREYVGTCERNLSLPKWCYASTPLFERFKSLYSPLGNSNPRYFYIYEKRHFGKKRAVLHFLTIHLRALIPFLWKTK